jgi:hypothetical protein
VCYNAAYLKAEVLFLVFHDHDQERQFDAERLARVSWACDKSVADVAAADL